MGGFTFIHLKNKSEDNINRHNAALLEAGLDEEYLFYSEKETYYEYEAFLSGEGNYPDRLFPRDKIKNYKDFKQYWHPDNIGETFCPHFGSLTFDCYCGRTSDKNMEIIAEWVMNNINEIGKVSGSFSLFIEKVKNKKLEQKCKNSHLKTFL